MKVYQDFVDNFRHEQLKKVRVQTPKLSQE
jgi:hypothetical protein